MAEKSSYWFPAKRYGWGWGLPTAWQGWVVFLAYLAIVPLAALRFMPHRRDAFGAVLAVSTILLILICYIKGEPPSWRWGDRE
jgi:hypothetical protein